MPSSDSFWPIVDFTTGEGVTVTEGTLDPSYFTSGAAFTRTEAFAHGLYLRVAEWTFAGTITIDPDGAAPITATFSIRCPAITTSGALASDEDDIAISKGWRGLTEDVEGDDGTPTPVDMGSAELIIWPALVKDPEGTDITFPAPTLNFYNLGNSGVSFGKAPYDDCPVTCVLPVTLGGSFDGTGSNSFTLQLGGPSASLGDPSIKVTGSFTLQPSSLNGWWPYQPSPDPEAIGPAFDSGTGEWLRTPRALPLRA